jgi:aryl-alcohol dehydrogenase-like predicted oxidoreductase
VDNGPLTIERRALGDTGVELPRLALGCGNFGGVGSSPAFFGQGLSEDDAFALMDTAWELGIDHFDTADAYGGGRSETAIGHWMAARGVRPTLTTKTYNAMEAGGDHGLSPERIERQLAASLKRLGVEHVELYLAHEFDPDVPLPHTLDAFEAQRSAGRIRAYGVSNFDASQLGEALEVGRPVAVQNSYSLMEHGDDTEVLPLCNARGVAYLAFSPLAGGWLTGKYQAGEAFPAGSRMTQRPEPYELFRSERTFRALDRLREFAKARRISMAGLALAWLLADHRIGQIVIGPGRPGHFEPAREALETKLDQVECEELEAVFS